jgi:hypothetical protein
MKKLLFFILGLTFFINLSAQDKEITTSKKNEFGFNAGATTGLGLSYRRWFGKTGVQLTGLPVKTEDVTFISLGVTALYTFYDSRHIRVYGFLGNHYIVDNERHKDYNWNGSVSNPEYNTTESESYNIGIGPAFSFGTVVRFNLMVGYGFYDVLDEIKMFPTGEIGLYFNFGKE